MSFLLFSRTAFAADTLKDLAPGSLVLPGIFLLILALAFTIAWIGPGHARTRRSLALLIILLATLGAMQMVLPLPLGAGMSLAVFLGIFAVIYLMGRFDSPE